MATQLFTNNATGSLVSSISSSATSLVLTAGQGALFPTITGADYFLVTLFDNSSVLEICKCTARSSDTLTVTRAQEGTTASGFATGSLCELRATKGTYEGVFTSATTAAAAAGAASTSATNAATSATNASASATTASTQATNAATSA